MSTELQTHHQFSVVPQSAQSESDASDNSDSSDGESIYDTYGSFTSYGRQETVMSRTLGLDDLEFLLTSDKIKDTLSGNPENWHWVQIQLWLHKENLGAFVPVFDIENEDNLKRGIEGEELLDLTLEKLFDESGPYNAGKKLNIKPENKETNLLIDRFFRELTKLELQTNDQIETDAETTINDLIEMKRRIHIFVDKWDKILWIDHFIETNHRIPSLDDISETLEISESLASVYVQYHGNMDRIQRKDLNELLWDFNVYGDSVIWWYLIISSLKTYPSKSMWLIFEKVAEITPASVAIELLEQYKFDLTRFNATKLDRVCQNIVVGSSFPICAALRIAKWFFDRAEYDVARSKLFEDIAQSYIDAANDYISFLESDHLATVLLEVKSDIDDMSALDMALEFKLQTFVSNNRVERVTTSIMNNFEFLKPKNRADAFEIEPISLDLIWVKLLQKEFYLTPLGLYVTTVLLYLCYLTLFTYLSVQRMQVYDQITTQEVVFWVLNLGYILNEAQQLISVGLKHYLSETANKFDALISCVFMTAFALRFVALFRGSPNCGSIESDCWRDGKMNTAFVMLWGISTIILWLRLITFCVLSHKLGPMVQMIFKMADDIVTFFEIMMILFLGFSFALMFILGDIHSSFDTPFNAALTLFTSILGDFDFESFHDATNIYLLYFGYGVMILYLIIGSLVLLNLLIAMMATTYEQIDANATATIIFARFELALCLDRDASFMPPPLNVVAILFMIIFYTVEKLVNFVRVCICCKHSYDLVALIMPAFIKARRLELDEQILWKNCGKSWEISTHRGPTVAVAEKYNPHLHKHYMKFYDNNGYEDDDTKWTGLRVSVQGDVAKKHCWLLDLMELAEQGLMDLKQFDQVKVDRAWTEEAQIAMHRAKSDQTVSPYWICGFCRGYIKESGSAISRLGRVLNVSDIELKLVNKVSPIVCPNCYRVRFERKRWEFVWEVLSIWIFYIFVFPLLFIIFGLLLFLRMLRDPGDMARRWELLKAKIRSAEKELVGSQGAPIANQEKVQYVSAHYNDSHLIATLNASAIEHKLFDSKVRNVVWEKLYTAKDAIDPFLLKRKISNHIISISTEDDMTPYEFFVKYINMESLRRNDGDTLWAEYFGPLSMTIFKRIHELRSDYLPLHLFSRYPFDVNGLMDDLEQHYEESVDYKEKKSLSSLSKEDLMHALNGLRFLNCSNEEERQYILDSIEQNNPRDDNAIFPAFLEYLSEVTSLFQSTRKIKNMLRDCNTALIERGTDASLFADQLFFLFDDIKDSVMALPFFNSLRTEAVVFSREKGKERKVELWTIRSTIMSLYFLKYATRRQILMKHKKQYLAIHEVLDIVFELFSKDIIDPDGITARITTNKAKEEDDEQKEQEELEERQNVFQRSFMKSRKRPSLIVSGAEDENDYSEEYEKRRAERRKVMQKRDEIFRKEQITALDIHDEITEIFRKLQHRRRYKITETTIDYYRRHGLEQVRLLQDDECLRFIYEQLARYITFNPHETKKECGLTMFKQILSYTVQFDAKGMYRIDEEAVPKRIRNNDNYTEQLYNHLKDILQSTEFDETAHDKGKKKNMTLEDVVSIITLYQRIFSVVQQKIIDSADEFVVNHDLFCKFVDPTDFKVDGPRDEWSNKTQAASNLYQSVLDIQQNFVTLGQIRQTVDVLLSDIKAMNCGELIRMINHIDMRMKADTQRCKHQREAYIKEVKNLNKQLYGTTLEKFEAMVNAEDAGATALDDYDDLEEKHPSVKSVRLQSVSVAKKAKRKNPSLHFKHITAVTWNNFIRHIANKFHHDIKSQEISDKLQNKEGSKEKQVIDVMLENTQFDIICDDAKQEDVIDETKEEKYDVDAAASKEEEEEKKRRLKKARLDVFDTILSFNSRRVTLQQLFGFARQFRTFLKLNKPVNDLMKTYQSLVLADEIEKRQSSGAIINVEISTPTTPPPGTAQSLQDLKNERIPSNFNDFKEKYFGSFEDRKRMSLKDFIAEIEWLYENTENEYVLCQRIYPFWGHKFINDIYSFMESTEQIQGIYELKAAEFGQLKYSLNVNHDNANKLFNIIRFKHRSLSWKQLYNFFVFVLRIKYNVQKAILNSKQAEDTTVSNDGMKILLKISLNDESQWLFDKVLFLNGAKVTWKQIRAYLTKTVNVRDTIRDFFADHQRDSNYHNKRAEIIHEISTNVDDIKNTVEKKEVQHDNVDNKDIVAMLKQIQTQNDEMRKEIIKLKSDLSNITTQQ
eukprot:528743_1